jgi:hypothetical protein
MNSTSSIENNAYGISCALHLDQMGIRFEVQQAGSRPLSYMDELKRPPAAVKIGARPSGGPCATETILFSARSAPGHAW